MIEFHDTLTASLRSCCANNAQVDTVGNYLERDYFAGYCLDAVEIMPAGSTRRVDPNQHNPYLREPFATPERCWR